MTVGHEGDCGHTRNTGHPKAVPGLVVLFTHDTLPYGIQCTLYILYVGSLHTVGKGHRRISHTLGHMSVYGVIAGHLSCPQTQHYDHHHRFPFDPAHLNDCLSK